MENITYINVVGVEQCELEGFPHIVEKLENFWGYPEFMDYYHSLMVTDRANRQGFPMKVLEELGFLYELYIDNLLLVSKNSMTAKQRVELDEKIFNTQLVNWKF